MKVFVMFDYERPVLANDFTLYENHVSGLIRGKQLFRSITFSKVAGY